MTTALLVIDVQESFRQSPDWTEVSNPKIISDVARLIKRARADGHEVIWILHASPGSGSVFDPTSGYVRPIEPLRPLGDESVFTKTSRNAFTTTALGQHLTRGGITDLVIAGIQTEQCCETTARLGADLGHTVTFVTEATATFPITRPDTGQRLEVDDIITRTEFALAGRFARIASIEEAFAAA
ncbi:MAG TPA: isochorismatase family protein [Lacisediminihabitans sp.]|uniref:cysteine hydrolase family protein n=1 Tax=Lacisediminihabitans sp. TaxID=2787631 RepID=UPI002EDB9ACE